MIESVQDIHRFDLGLAQYRCISAMAWLLVVGLVLVAGGAVALGGLWWGMYGHVFTPYLKWQDAVLAFCWFVGFTALGGVVLVGRFLYALRKGRREGMLTLVGSTTLYVRDLSPENFKSVFTVLNSAFWCFIVGLVGLVPGVLLGWMLQLSPELLAVVAICITVVLGLVGLGISLVAGVFIIVGCIGCVSFGYKLGLSQRYELNGRTSLSMDNFVLTILQPDRPESMVDLRLLSSEDQKDLLVLLHQCWIDGERRWSPGFGEELARALEGINVSPQKSLAKP